jgi:hypothetical protein
LRTGKVPVNSYLTELHMQEPFVVILSFSACGKAWNIFLSTEGFELEVDEGR